MLAKTRMRKSVVAEVYPGFMAGCYSRELFLASSAFINAQRHALRTFRRDEMEKTLAKIK
jgi:hypothetical protein